MTRRLSDPLDSREPVAPTIIACVLSGYALSLLDVANMVAGINSPALAADVRSTAAR